MSGRFRALWSFVSGNRLISGLIVAVVGAVLTFWLWNTFSEKKGGPKASEPTTQTSDSTELEPESTEEVATKTILSNLPCKKSRSLPEETPIEPASVQLEYGDIIAVQVGGTNTHIFRFEGQEGDKVRIALTRGVNENIPIENLNFELEPSMS